MFFTPSIPGRAGPGSRLRATSRRAGILRALLAATACAALLAACGGRAAGPVLGLHTAPGTAGGQAVQPGGTAPGADGGGGGARNVLATRVPSTQGLAAGAEFELVVSVELAGALYQGSGRVLYDSRAVQPVGASRGALIPPGAVFVAKLDAPAGMAGGASSATGVSGAGGTRLDGVVPYAFTALPGQAAIPPGSGELVRLRFRLLAPCSACPVRLLNDPAYLQLRDSAGRRLAFDLREEVAAR
jgi:hypothetical protein